MNTTAIRSSATTSNALRFPGKLLYQGRQINRAGADRALRSMHYADLARGNTLEVFMMRVIYAKPEYAVLVVIGDEAIGKIKVAAPYPGLDRLNQGDLLLGTLRFGEPMKVDHLWMLMPAPVAHPPAPRLQPATHNSPAPVYRPSRPATPQNHGAASRRVKGTIITCHGDVAHAVQDGTGTIFSVESSRLIGNIPWKVGSRVDFVPQGSSEKPLAGFVRAAA